jgi:tetratricopeptide (TPR) repeat protein
MLSGLAAARLRLEDWAGAEQVAEQLRAIDDTDAAKVQAALLSGQKRYGESIELMQRLAAEPGATSDLMAGLVQVYVMAGQTREARAYINKVLAENPKNARALRLSGALYQLGDDQEAAEQAFRDAILAEPLNAVGYLVLSRYLKGQNREADGEEILRAGVANVPGNIVLHIDLADSFLRRGAFDEAIREFEVVYDLQPDSIIAANNLASMLADFHADKPDLVDRAYSIARRLAGSNKPEHMDTYGWILYLRGDYAQALRSLKPAAEQLKNSPWTQYHAGMAYLKLNKPEEARRHLQAALDAGGAHMFPLREQVREALDQLTQ